MPILDPTRNPDAYISISSNTTLTAQQVGHVYTSGTLTVTLPTSPSTGTKYKIYGNIGGVVSISSPVNLVFPDGTTGVAYNLPLTLVDTGIVVMYDGTQWRAETFGNIIVSPASQADHAVQLGQFTSNLLANLRTRGYYGLLDNCNMARLPTNGSAPITVGTNPYGVAYCPTNDRIYVVNDGSASVSVIIPTTGVVTATITVGTNPYGVAY